jgi:MFS family permease
VGGEYGTSATYLSEMATKKDRGFYSSFQYVTLIMGQLLALGVLILLQRVFLTSKSAIAPMGLAHPVCYWRIFGYYCDVPAP